MSRANYDDPLITDLRQVMAELQELMREAKNLKDHIRQSQIRLGDVVDLVDHRIEELAKRIESDESLATREMQNSRPRATPQQIRDSVLELLHRVQRPMKTTDLCSALRHTFDIEDTKQVYNALYTDRRFTQLGKGARDIRWWFSDVAVPYQEV